MAKNTNKLDESIYSTVQQYLNAVAQSGTHVDATYVFGSYAKGTQHKWSDVDLCLVTNSFTTDRHTLLVKLMNLRQDATDIIEPHIYTEHDLANKYDPLAGEILKYGIKVA